jgi:hypothetical protein
MVLKAWKRGSLAMRVRLVAVAGLVLAISVLAGLAAGWPASPGPESLAGVPSGGSIAPAVPAALAEEGPDDVQQTVFTPGSTYRVSIVADGGPLRIGVRLTSGASLGGTLYGPAGCPTDAFMTTVIGLATSGQELASTECQVPAGRLTVAIDTGESAFLGSIELNGGTFA